jgi:uncharacterized membrane protein
VIYLLIGIFLFLGAHSVRIWADPWRDRMLARLGEARWKGLHALTSAIGLGLLIWGFGLARQEPVQLWIPPNGMRHLASVLMLGSFVLLAAAYVPGNRIKARLRHPMVLSVKLWALAHLLANGNLAHGVLFGAFLVWAVLSFRAARRRDRLAGMGPDTGSTGATGVAVALGVAAWLAFTLYLHGLLIGVRPLG